MRPTAATIVPPRHEEIGAVHTKNDLSSSCLFFFFFFTSRAIGVAFKTACPWERSTCWEPARAGAYSSAGPPAHGSQARVGAPPLLSAERQIPAEPPALTLLLLSIEKCTRLNYTCHGQHHIKDELCRLESILKAPGKKNPNKRVSCLIPSFVLLDGAAAPGRLRR